MPYIDSAILDVTEWLCRKLQVLTGKTNVWLAMQLTNVSIIVYFVWAGMYFVEGDRWQRLAIAAFCGGLMYVLTQTIFKVPIEAYEKNAYERVSKGLRNPRRIRDAMLRISFLTMSIFLAAPTWLVYVTLHLLIVAVSYSLIVLMTVVLYLLACDPLPPCAAKLKEWFRGVAPARLQPSESTGGRRETSRPQPIQRNLERRHEDGEVAERCASGTGRTDRNRRVGYDGDRGPATAVIERDADAGRAARHRQSARRS